MIQISAQHLTRSAFFAVVASVTVVALLFAAFFLAEPSISYGQVDTTPDFSIRQTIVDETAFLVDPADVTTNGSINGVTGGAASGTAQFSVISNNSTGYFVNITFENNGTPNAMLGDVTASEALRDYDGDAAGPLPSYGYTASTAAQFAYTITSDTSSDTSDNFLNNSTVCGAGSNQNGATKCWKAPATTAYEIVNRNTSAITGATSTLEFDITVPSGATPVPSAETYTATATLTLFTQ